MSPIAASISAVSATLAAVLAALNLYLSGHREQAKWAREALVDILVSFLDESFRSKDAVKHAIRGLKAGQTPDDVFALLTEALEAEREMRRMQTRLRLLAPPEVVDAAQILRVATRTYIELCLERPSEAQAADAQQRRQLWHLRQEFTNIAKHAIVLPKRWRAMPKTTPTEGL